MMTRGKNELIELNGKKFELKTSYEKDGREYVDYFECMKNFLGMEQSEAKSIMEKIPRSYFKNLVVDEKKIKMLDRMALGLVLNHTHNFDFYNWVVGRHIATFDNYTVELFCNSCETMLFDIEKMSDTEKTIKKYNDIQQDMLHDLENSGRDSDEEKIIFFDTLEKIRHERRQYKNKFAFDKSIKEYFEKHNIDKASLEGLLKIITRQHYVFEKKIYNMRGQSVAHQEIKEVVAKKIEAKKKNQALTEKDRMKNLNKMMRRARIK